jgi:hypothetical protein
VDGCYRRYLTVGVRIGKGLNTSPCRLVAGQLLTLEPTFDPLSGGN